MWATNLGEPDGMASWFREKKKGEVAPWMSREQVKMHAKILKMSGYTGPLNWYNIFPLPSSHLRSSSLRYKQAMVGITAKTESNVTDEQKKIKTPTLFIGAERDVICLPALQEANMKPWMEDLTVEGVYTGHWCMLEKPDDTWALVDKFIKARL
jgi:pimeloyl-ACP methyl ester carboxylesterase